jgi:hypothetical protein
MGLKLKPHSGKSLIHSNITHREEATIILKVVNLFFMMKRVRRANCRAMKVMMVTYTMRINGV